MKEGVTTLPGSLNVNPPEWTTAHHNVPPEWLDQVDHPCMVGGRHGTMQIQDGRLICVVSPGPVTVTPREAKTSIQGEDLDHIHKGMMDTLKAHNLHPFMVRNTAHAWQVFHKGWNEGRINGHELYKKYNDSHFETAFRKIFKTGVPKESKMKPLAFDIEAELREASKGLTDLPFHMQLAHAVTRYDRRQEDAARKNPRRYYNIHALPLYLQAADRTHEDIKKGKSVVDAINNNFVGSLADHIHRTLKTGGMSTDKANRLKWREDTDMDDDVMTEATTLRFASPSRVQIAKAQVYWDIHRRQKGIGKVKVGPIEGTDGNWYFDVTSNDDNQFLVPSKMNNILPGGVTVTSGVPVIPSIQNASQDETPARDAVRKMVESLLGEAWKGGRGPTKQQHRERWMSDLTDQVTKLSPEHSGKIDWDTAAFHYNQGKSAEEAAKSIVSRPPVNRR